jgi:multidrug efflux pump subunit AcrA (membrane-fusion protein)
VVVARTQSDLGFRVQGKILERFGGYRADRQTGQPLLRLDPVDLKLQAQAQRARWMPPGAARKAIQR